MDTKEPKPFPLNWVDFTHLTGVALTVGTGIVALWCVIFNATLAAGISLGLTFTFAVLWIVAGALIATADVRGRLFW